MKISNHLFEFRILRFQAQSPPQLQSQKRGFRPLRLWFSLQVCLGEWFLILALLLNIAPQIACFPPHRMRSFSWFDGFGGGVRSRKIRFRHCWRRKSVLVNRVVGFPCLLRWYWLWWDGCLLNCIWGYLINMFGTPQQPNPPARMVWPLVTGFMASWRDFTLLNCLRIVENIIL